jgi:2-C-methyl-D-erythritol 4-phosphate cytidylyltransferase
MGTRIGRGPKAFLQLGGQSIITKVVHTLSPCVNRILVGVPSDYCDRARDELKGLAEVFPGGATRQETVFILLNQCAEQIVVIYDVTRPFASQSLIEKVIDAGRQYGAAVSCIPSLTPVATCKDNFITESIPLPTIRLTQSPQAFHRDILEQAYQKALEKGLETQTTWELVLHMGVPVRAVMGEEGNIKITTPLDWEIANKVLAQKKSIE